VTKFSASVDIEPLDYDFKPYVDTKGTVPEPSNEAVTEFYAGIGNMLEAALGEDRLGDILTPAELIDFKLRKPEPLMKVQAATSNVDDMNKASELALDLHAAVCGGSPSRDDLAALPYRVRQAFYGALQRWLSPDASRPAGND
jgi:hypothetical protein